jgi:hypothetical protein
MGVFYLVAVEGNRPTEIVEMMVRRGFVGEVFGLLDGLM